MATIERIIKSTFRIIGIPNPSNTDLANGLEKINDLISSWSAEQLLTHFNTRETKTLTISKSIYTWGTGGDITTTRPISIIDMYITDSNGNDYPMREIPEEQYNDINLKTNEGRPDRFYYTTEYPLGKLFLYPTPNAAETLTISTWKAISELSTLSASVVLPNEYKRALVYNLLLDLAPEYGYQVTQNEFNSALEAKELLRNVNFKDMIFQFPKAVTKGNIYNIDTFYRRF